MNNHILIHLVDVLFLSNVFISQIWKELHKELGSIVEYSPLYSSQSLGGVERQHKDLKCSLKATLLAMGDAHQSSWMSVLPWTLLHRRTAYHSELQASPSELVLGENPALPGELAGTDLPDDKTLEQLLDRLRTNARRPPAQTTIRRQPAVYYPLTTQTATHAYLRRQKTKPLEPPFAGPYVILERLGKSSIKLHTGHYKNGLQRHEIHHWKNCHPMILPMDTKAAEKPALGRKPAQS